MTLTTEQQTVVREFTTRIEAIEEEIAALNSDKSQFYKAAKDHGLNVKVLRRHIANRRKRAADREGFDAEDSLLVDYEHAMDAPRAHAREEAA